VNKIPKELRVGLLAIFCAVVLYKGISFLKGSELFRTTNVFYLVYDRIDGLQEGNSVLLNGAPVGIVKKLSLMFDNNNRVLVKIEIQKEVKADKKTVGTMLSSSLLGGKVIELTLGDARQLLKDGDTLKAAVAEDIADQIKKETKPLLSTAEKSLKQITETLQRLSTTLEKADVALASFATTSDGVSALMTDNKDNFRLTTANIVTLTKNFTQTERELRELLSKMNRLGDTLNNAHLGQTLTRAADATATLNKLLIGINNGQGTMGKLAKNDSLYRNLNASSASLDALLKDFKANPKRYVHFSVFGGKK
jgi:phospholipid/cholesterol/gamma-HCH transport system substrate-binding protein